MRILTLLLMLTALAFGYKYNTVLLDAQVSIFPRILLLETALKDKLVDGKIVFTIVYEKGDRDAAREVAQKIDESYKGAFEGYAYLLKLVKFSDLTAETDATAIYALRSSGNLANVAKVAQEKGIVAFSYDTKNLSEGLVFSLVLEKSTVLYLNKNSLSENNIDFVSSLYQIVRFIE